MYSSHTTYNYTLNNPLRYTDPDGRSVENEYKVTIGNDGEIAGIEQTGTKGGDETDFVTFVDSEGSSIETNQDGSAKVYEYAVQNVIVNTPGYGGPTRVTSRDVGTITYDFGQGPAIATLDGSDDPFFQLFTLGGASTIKGAGVADDLVMSGLPRVPKGKSFWDVIKGKAVKGGQWMRRKLNGYLELDPKTIRDAGTKATTGSPRDFDTLTRENLKNFTRAVGDAADGPG